MWSGRTVEANDTGVRWDPILPAMQLIADDLSRAAILKKVCVGKRNLNKFLVSLLHYWATSPNKLVPNTSHRFCAKGQKTRTIVKLVD